MSNLSTALLYLDKGYSVFPTPPLHKAPYSFRTVPSATLKHGCKDGTTNPEKVLAWWREEPDRNIGIPTGEDVWVFDIDSYKIPELDGKSVPEILAWTEARILKETGKSVTLPETKMVRTASGGLHLWYEGDESVTNDHDLFGTKIDVRGVGGYAIAEGSTVKNPETGEVGKYTALNDLEPQRASKELLDALKRTDTPQNYGSLTSEAWATLSTDQLSVARSATKDKVRKILTKLTKLDDKAAWGPHIWSAARDLVRVGRTAETGFTLDKLWSVYSQTCESISSPAHDSPDKAASYWRLALRDVKDFEPVPPVSELPTTFRPRMWTRDYFGMSDRMRAYYPGQSVWLSDADRWATYTDGKWRLDKGESTGALYRSMVERMPAVEGPLYSSEAADDAKDSPRDVFNKWVGSLRGPSARKDTMAQLKDDSHDLLDNFDTQLHYLGLQDGAFNLSTLEQEPYTPEMRITKFCAFSYDPMATCPVWEKFLSEILPDPEDRAYVRRAMAYTLLGTPDQKRLFILHGKTNTGKTTLLKTLEAMLGDYARKLNSRAIYQKATGDQSWDINDAKGKRLVYVSEPDKHNTLDAGTVKDFSGNGSMNSRAMYQGNDSWHPEGVLWIDANNLPSISDEEKDIWPRIKVIFFPVQFSDAPGTPENRLIDRTLDKRLLEEIPGIFNWLVEELRQYEQDAVKFIEPPNVVKASRKYQTSQDTTIEFLTDLIDSGKIIAADHVHLPRPTLFAEYVKWYRDENHPSDKALGKMAFNERVDEIYSKRKTNGVLVWEGIGWASDQPIESRPSLTGNSGVRHVGASREVMNYADEQPTTFENLIEGFENE